MDLKSWHWWRFDCLGQQIVRVSDGSPTPTHIAEKVPNRLFKHTIQLSKKVTLYLIIIPKYCDVSLEMYDAKHYRITVEHTYDACPKYSELGSFRIIAYLYVSDGSCR